MTGRSALCRRGADRVVLTRMAQIDAIYPDERAAALGTTTSAVKLHTMMQVKRTLDPKMILNPGKVLPQTPSAKEKTK